MMLMMMMVISLTILVVVLGGGISLVNITWYTSFFPLVWIFWGCPCPNHSNAWLVRSYEVVLRLCNIQWRLETVSSSSPCVRGCWRWNVTTKVLCITVNVASTTDRCCAFLCRTGEWGWWVVCGGRRLENSVARLFRNPMNEWTNGWKIGEFPRLFCGQTFCWWYWWCLGLVS